MARDEHQRMHQAAALMEAVKWVNAAHDRMARELEASRAQLAQAQAAEQETRRKLEELQAKGGARSREHSPPSLSQQASASSSSPPPSSPPRISPPATHHPRSVDPCRPASPGGSGNTSPVQPSKPSRERAALVAAAARRKGTSFESPSPLGETDIVCACGQPASPFEESTPGSGDAPGVRRALQLTRERVDRPPPWNLAPSCADATQPPHACNLKITGASMGSATAAATARGAAAGVAAAAADAAAGPPPCDEGGVLGWLEQAVDNAAVADAWLDQPQASAKYILLAARGRRLSTRLSAHAPPIVGHWRLSARGSGGVRPARSRSAPPRQRQLAQPIGAMEGERPRMRRAWSFGRWSLRGGGGDGGGGSSEDRRERRSSTGGYVHSPPDHGRPGNESSNDDDEEEEEGEEDEEDEDEERDGKARARVDGPRITGAVSGAAALRRQAEADLFARRYAHRVLVIQMLGQPLPE